MGPIMDVTAVKFGTRAGTTMKGVEAKAGNAAQSSGGESCY